MSRVARRRAQRGLTVGSVVADRYRLDKKLGEGGMAEVFRVTDLETSELRALKVLHRDIAGKQEAVDRAMREGKVLTELDNPAIVSVEAFGQLPDGMVYLVMELLEGETLGARMRGGAMEPAELAPLVAGTCAGLHAAHAKGVVHRDLKPDNIFLCPTDHGLQVKLLDFGISKVFGGERITQTGEVLGTPRYMSPEQLGAEADVDGRIDTYSLGVILYEAMAEKPPFLGSTPTDLIVAILHGKVVPLRSVRPEIPEQVEAVVMRAFEKNREARFSTALELAEAYVEAVGGVATVRAQQVRGLATRAFGGIHKEDIDKAVDAQRAAQAGRAQPAGPPATRRPPSTPPDPVSGSLSLGTFDGLDGSPTAAELAPSEATPSKETAVMGAAHAARVPDAPAGPPKIESPTEEDVPAPEPMDRISVSSAFPTTRETPYGFVEAALKSLPEGRSRQAVPETALMDASMMEASGAGLGPAPSASIAGAPAPVDPSIAGHTAPVHPSVARGRAAPRPIPATRASRRERGRLATVLLILGALLAGALSAGALIAALHVLNQPSGDDEPEPEVDEEPMVSPPELTVSELVPEPGEVATEEVPPGVDVPPPQVLEEPVAQAPEPAPQQTARRATRPTPSPRPAPTVTEAASDPIRTAREALRGGDPERCIRILDEAIRSGTPTITLRRRAECHEAAGHRSAAVADYQRFCRLAHDHPSIGEVRGRLESWGYTCP